MNREAHMEDTLNFECPIENKLLAEDVCKLFQRSSRIFKIIFLQGSSRFFKGLVKICTDLQGL